MNTKNVYLFRIFCRYCGSRPHFQRMHDADGIKVQIYCVCGNETRWYPEKEWDKCKAEWQQDNKKK